MRTRDIVFAAGCGLIVSGCAAPPDHTQEIIDNLVRAGFAADDIMVVDGAVYVGRDAEVSLAASREMLEAGPVISRSRATSTAIAGPTSPCGARATATGS